MNGNTSEMKHPGDIITVDSDIALEAQYADYYSIAKPTDIPNGWIDTDRYTADEGDTVRKDNESGDVLYTKEGEHGQNLYSFEMPGCNIYITAEFEEDIYTVECRESENGTVSADRTEFILDDVSYGSDDPVVTLTVTPDSGYELKKLVCKAEDDTVVELTKVTDTEYTFEMTTKSVAVTAAFVRVYDDGIGEHLAGYSLSLSGNIGVNFYMELDVTASDIDRSSHSSSLRDGVIFEGASLSLKSETTLSLYFTGIPADTEFDCIGKNVETVSSGKYVIARIRGIKAAELNNDFTVRFGGNSITYSPMNYCYNVLAGNYDDNHKNVCKALFRYWQEAKAYRDSLIGVID